MEGEIKSAKANFVAVRKIYRHFDQVKRVEKSPKAKQYFSPTVIQSVSEESPGKGLSPKKDNNSPKFSLKVP